MKTYPLLFSLCAALFSATVRADEWPQWQHDAHRSGVTEEVLPTHLKKQWELALGNPAPAYDYQYRMCADYSYAPISAEGMLFVPSGVTDQLMAFDLKTGALNWRYVTDGPVRFAPVYRDGKLYVTSDDGYLHCLTAASGKLLWKTRGVPEGTPDMRMLVNGRMVSRWPARGGAVLHDDKVYFGAGIWPEEGSYVNAVDANSGALLWQNDALSIIEEGMCDHGSNLDLSLPPQGYMAVFGNRLAVTSGRTLAAWFDLETGEMDPYSSFYVKKSNPRGTWYLTGNDEYWVQGGCWFGTRPDGVPPRPEGTRCPLAWSSKSPDNALFQLKNRPFLVADVTSSFGGEIYYSEPILTADTSYTSIFDSEDDYQILNGETFVEFREYDRIVAKDITKPQWKTVKASVDMGIAGKQEVSIIEFPVKWEFKTTLKTLIKTGDHLIAGGAGRIAAIALPQKGKPAKISWEAKIDGHPVNTLFADGNLVTVTDTGTVYCFGNGASIKPTVPHRETLKSSPKNGYLLLMGLGEEHAALEWATNPDWRVVILEQDAAKVRALRTQLNELGLYGKRAQILLAHAEMELTPYWASRVILNDPAVLGSTAQTLASATHALRPFSGRLQLTPKVDRQLLAQQIEGQIDYRIDGDWLTRVCAPEGSADWTQESAQGDNSFISQEKRVKWPLGVLWYSGDIDNFLPPYTDLTHIRNPYPLVKNGRLFMFTHEILHCYDIYTGNYLWTRKVPETPYINTRHYLNRLYGRPTDRNYVLADDAIYCVTGDQIHVFDSVTGESKKSLSIPEQFQTEAQKPAAEHFNKKMRDYSSVYEIQPTPEWTEVRIWNDTLLAKVGNRLIAMNRKSGKLIWSHQGTLEYTLSTIGNGTLYALDCIPDEYTRKEKQFEKTGELFAIRIADGKQLWSRPIHYPSWPKIVSKNIVPWMKKAMPALGYNTKHNLLIMTYNGMSARAINADDGSELWTREVASIKEPSWLFTPNILDDYVMMSLSKYQGGMGYLVDILTGEKTQQDPNVPRARTCGRMIGNSHLLSYRDGATELYDLEKNLTIPLNSLRTGCTTSFIPACGIMSAPMMAHGCVCNYPMFASMAMVHMPESDTLRPAAVVASWGSDQRKLHAELSNKKTRAKPNKKK